MEALDDAIRLRVVRGSAVAFYTERKHLRSPKVGLELTSAIEHNTPGQTKPCNPTVQQGSCASFHCHVGYSFTPASVAVETCEEVTERIRLGKWDNNVYMNVVETAVRDGRTCGMRPWCVAGF